MRRLCSPGHRELERRPARAPRRARRAAPCASQSSNSASTSARDANVVWWSRSTFRSTAISGRSAATERSDSSPSTTSQPSPARALPPSCGTSPPMRNAGSRPSRSRQNAIIALVVVLPCAPATTIERRSETSSASRSARGRPVDAAGERGRHVRPPSPSGGSGGSGEIATSIPARCARYGVSTRSQPADLRAPRVRERARTRSCPRRRCRRSRCAYRRAAASSTSSSAILSAASGRAAARIAAAIAREPRRVGEQRSRRAPARGRAPPPARRPRRPRVRTTRAFFALVAAGRELAGNEHGRQPGGGELPDRAARARDGEVGGAVAPAPISSMNGQQHVVGPRRASAQRVVVALAAEVQHRRPDSRPTRRARARSAAARRASRRTTSTTGPSAGRPSRSRASARGDRAASARAPAARRRRTSLRPRPATGSARKTRSRERRREPVGEAEMRIRLGQRGRDPAQPRGEHHRAGDVAAAAEHDVRPAALEDPQAGDRRAPRRARARAAARGPGRRGKPATANASNA